METISLFIEIFSRIIFKIKKINEDQFNKINTLLDNTKAANKKDLELRTSSKKSKTINVKDLKKIDNELKKSKNQWSGPTRLWIRAGILAGLRPSEWKDSEFIEESNSLKLIVKNAKNTNGRSHGDKRTIDLSHLEENEISIIKQHLKVTLGMVNQEYWNEYYLGCSNLLRYIGKKIWKNKKRRPSLYTSRHQFSANSKASGCTPKELAALMGHASDLTSQMTYGKKVNGTRGKKPKANKAEMRNVKESNKLNKFSFDNY